jgi:hypothetical protein
VKSKSGVEIMKKGGNAFDAMVARTSISLPTPETLVVVDLWFIEKMEKER